PCRDRMRIHECGAASMDSVLRGDTFDLIIACLMLGELPEDIRLRTLEIAAEHLSDTGRIVICDELWPRNRALSALYHVLFAVFAIPNFILTRTMIRPVKDLPELLERCRLRIVRKERFFFNALSVLYVQKE
ncbi:hypothetical protein LCGC14_1959080, partial [marine sediment metagenome]